jgi:hypothetical protein
MPTSDAVNGATNLLFATIEWCVAGNARTVRITTNRPLADDATRQQLKLNGEPSAVGDPCVLHYARVPLGLFLTEPNTELQLALFCDFLRAICEYLFNHETTPRDARKTFHYVREGRFILGHGHRMLAADVNHDAFQLTSLASRAQVIDVHHIRTHEHTELLIRFLIMNSVEAFAMIVRVANESLDPNDLRVIQALKRAEATGPVVA